MTVWAWLRLTVTLWLLRKAFKLTGWLLLALLALALWPVTIVTAAGYTAAWLRGWPPARLRRAAAGSLTAPAVYAAAVLARQHGSQAAALAPARDYPAGWHHLAALDAARTFLTLAPASRSRSRPSSPATSGETPSRACRHPAMGQDAGDPCCEQRVTAHLGQRFG